MFPRTLAALAMSAALLTSTPPRADNPPSDQAPVDCVGVARIDKTNIIDDQTILFFMRGGKQIYQNHLPQKCPWLEISDGFGYNATGGRLCAIDRITPAPRVGDLGVCKLGEFQPITAEQVKKLIAAHESPDGDEAGPVEPPKESAAATPAQE